MANEIKKEGAEIKPHIFLPDSYKAKKTKGKPYAFYGYKHYEVYPGDLFFGIHDGYVIFGEAQTKGRFEPFDISSLFDETRGPRFEGDYDFTLKALPGGENGSERILIEELKTRLTKYFERGLIKRDAPNYLKEMKEGSFGEKTIELKLGFFRHGSKRGSKFALPDMMGNEPHIILNGWEKDFMEPYFEAKIPGKGEKKMVFRKIPSWEDFFNLAEDGDPELLLDSESIKTRISHPYLYIPADWVHSIYVCSRGTEYNMEHLYDYFTEQFRGYRGMSIVNLKQQMMPYYQRHSRNQIPRDLRREDVIFLCEHWFAQDVRDGTYYHLRPTIENPDGSYFCLDWKWFWLFHDRVRRYGKKKVCNTDDFKFRSSHDKRYFQLFCLDEGDLPYAFEAAIDTPNFEEFFDKMDMRFNPAYPKSGAIESEEHPKLTPGPEQLPGEPPKLNPDASKGR